MAKIATMAMDNLIESMPSILPDNYFREKEEEESS